jgi:hypothetical protein
MLEEKIAALVAAVEANTAAVEKLNAGRDVALAKLEEKVTGGEAKPATRRRKAAETKAEEPATEPAAAAAETKGAFDDEVLRSASKNYIAGGKTEDERAARHANIKTIVDHFGGKLVGPESTLDDEQKAQALFYVKRFAAGCKVDYSQDYDFAGDPTQDGLDAGSTDDFDDIG